MKIFKLCKAYLSKCKNSLIIYVILIFATSAISIAIPYITGNFFDILIDASEILPVLKFSLLIVGFSLIRIIKNYFTTLIHSRVSAIMAFEFNQDVIDHIQNLSLSYTQKNDNAYMNSRVNSDVTSLIGFCMSVFQNIVMNLIMIIIPLIILIRVNWVLSFILLFFVALYCILFNIFKNSIYTSGYELRESQNMFLSSLFDRLNYIRFIKTNSIQSEISLKTKLSFSNLYDKIIYNQKVNYLYSSLEGVVSICAQVSLFILGGIQVVRGIFTIGMFTVFISYFNMILNAGRYFFGLGGFYRSVLASHDRIKNILDLHPEKNGTTKIDDVFKIEMKDINFTYSNNIKKVIEEFNFSFRKGNIYLLYGKNSVGKSTILNLLIGMYVDEVKGKIIYNDIDIRKINMYEVRKNFIGFADQDAILLNDSIDFNITYKNSPNESLLKIKKKSFFVELLNILNMRSFITNNNKFKQMPEEISSGEKHKISILKVLNKNPAVMIFDESIAAMDEDVVNQLMKYLNKIKKNKIIIFAARDFTLRDFCDIIIEM